MGHESIATSVDRGEELHFVLLDYTEQTRAPDEPACDLLVYRRHLSPERENLFAREFCTIHEAKEFCRREYGVRTHAWGIPPTLEQKFTFEYQLSNIGVAQPFPVGFDDAKIVFRLSTYDDLGDGEPSPVLDICGTKEGLRQLAAFCLLCADSDQYDDSFHVHLEGDENVDSNVAVTIRAPSYYNSISQDEFSEARSKMIIVSKESTDEPPNNE